MDRIKIIKCKFMIIGILFLLNQSLFAKEVTYTLEDRDRLIRIEVSLKEFKDAVDKRFEQVDKRFEQVDKRFEQVDKRFEELREDMNKRFGDMFNFLWILAGIFTTLTCGVMGYAWWDRRTVISKAKGVTIEEIEKEGKLKDLIMALREIAKKDVELQNVLRTYHLL